MRYEESVRQPLPKDTVRAEGDEMADPRVTNRAPGRTMSPAGDSNRRARPDNPNIVTRSTGFLIAMAELGNYARFSAPGSAGMQ
jgi:hypothetical protein